MIPLFSLTPLPVLQERRSGAAAEYRCQSLAPSWGIIAIMTRCNSERRETSLMSNYRIETMETRTKRGVRNAAAAN